MKSQILGKKKKKSLIYFFKSPFKSNTSANFLFWDNLSNQVTTSFFPNILSVLDGELDNKKVWSKTQHLTQIKCSFLRSQKPGEIKRDKSNTF